MMDQKRWKGFCAAMCMVLAVLLAGHPCYAAEKETKCEVTLPVQIELAGDSAPAKEMFEISITNKDINAPMPEITAKTAKSGEQISFGPIIYTLPGDYHYVITQKKGSAPQWIYDQTVYEITVRIVNDKEGGLSSEIWAVRSASDKKSEQIRFINHYETPELFTAPTVKSPHTGEVSAPEGYIGMMGASLLALLYTAMKHQKLRDRKY